MRNNNAINFLAFVFLISISISCGQNNRNNSAAKLIVPDKVDFNFHVKPILSDKCFACHGPDLANQKGDLRLDTEEGAFKTVLDPDVYPIVPGEPEKSEVYFRIISKNRDQMMPPPESNLKLSEYEIKVLIKWIEQGAEYKPHWAFTPPTDIAVPDIEESDWPTNPVDNFIAQKLEEIGLDHNEEASKEELIRRATFDIIGISPTPKEIDDFIDDESDNAYEKVVDRLLSSPHYGERMTSDWLDVARYADSHGYQDDRPRTMWPWRDWVVKAYNENLPYDDFVTWQLAGDLLPNPTFDQKIASGFNRNHAITQEGGIIEEEYLTEYAADRVQTFGTAFVGLTMQCSRCHDHKYDPISQKEFYQVYAFFNSIKERGKISYFDLAPEPSITYENEALESEVEEIKKMLTNLEIEKEQYHLKVDDESLKEWFGSLNWESLRTEGLETHYKLDFQEGGSLKDEVSKKYSGTLNYKLGDAIPIPDFVDGKFGKALEFDSTNTLTIGDIGDFEHYNEFSIGGWIKPSMTPNKKAGIISRRNGEQKQGGYGLYLAPDNSLSMELIHSSKYKITVKTKEKIRLDKWTNVYGTYDGSGKASGIKLYVNGTEQTTHIEKDSLFSKSILVGNQITIGHWMMRGIDRSKYGGFIGSIDEISVYNRMLSPFEVKYLFDKNPVFNKERAYQAYLIRRDDNYSEINRKLTALRSKDTVIPKVMIMEELDTLKPAYVLARGVYSAHGEQVVRGTPASILEFSNDLPKNRLGLSKWLFDEKNPLTSRVIVNRFWQTFFGKGIVKTPEDFGNQGAIPSHPELLDWLALDFMNNGWDMKRLVKTLVMSSTYRQSSKIDKKFYYTDTENIYLSRGPYKKLTAEMMRDQALASSGLLNKKIGGKWVKPYQPPGIWKELANQIGENKYRASKGEDLYRRSLYTYWKRTIPVPSMITFDAAERAMCTVKRQATSTPLQSLVLLNDPQYLEASRALAQSVIRLKNESPSEWINQAFKSIVSRAPTSEEVEMLLKTYHAEVSRFSSEQNSSDNVLKIGDSKIDPDIKKINLAAMTIVVNAIMNLDEAKHA
ncbi:MAG: DUF1553 domain-containing protein [Cyclobacteriaceae bacterium]